MVEKYRRDKFMGKAKPRFTLIVETSESSDAELIVTCRGSGANKWAKETHGTIMGNRWEGLEHEDPDSAYAIIDRPDDIEKALRKDGYTEAEVTLDVRD